MSARFDRHVLVPFYGDDDETVRMWVPWSRHSQLASDFVCTGQRVEYEGELLEVWVPTDKWPRWVDSVLMG